MTGPVAVHPSGLHLSAISTHLFNTQAFYCGDGSLACPEINEFVKMRARKEHFARASTTYILHEPASPEILGYITTAMGSIRYKVLDKTQFAGALHIAYVGRTAGQRGKGLGQWLVKWAITESDTLSQRVGCRGVSLWCYSDRLQFYKDALGFDQYAPEKRDPDTGEIRYPMLWDLGSLTDTPPPNI